MATISAERVGGLTNKSYKFAFEGGTYVARFPGTRTSEFIDRQAEAINAKLASASGLGPDVVYCDGATGLMVTRFISGAKSPGPEDLKRAAVLRRVVVTLKTLHEQGPVLATDFDPFRTIERYMGYLGSRGGTAPKGYQTALYKAKRIQAALRASRWQRTACHVDPMPENFLDNGERVYLLDWEYAGNGDAFWDLAALSVEAAFDGRRDRSLLKIYLGRPPLAAELARLSLYKIVCDLMWTPWGAIQMINEHKAIDYWSYAKARCERAARALARPDFTGALRAVQEAKT